MEAAALGASATQVAIRPSMKYSSKGQSSNRKINLMEFPALSGAQSSQG